MKHLPLDHQIHVMSGETDLSTPEGIIATLKRAGLRSYRLKKGGINVESTDQIRVRIEVQPHSEPKISPRWPYFGNPAHLAGFVILISTTPFIFPGLGFLPVLAVALIGGYFLVFMIYLPFIIQFYRRVKVALGQRVERY